MRDFTRMATRALVVCIILGAAACESSDPGDQPCASVEVEHLARPIQLAGLTIVCNPKHVSAPYRDRYFPGYQWGDETWTTRQR